MLIGLSNYFVDISNNEVFKWNRDDYSASSNLKKSLKDKFLKTSDN